MDPMELKAAATAAIASFSNLLRLTMMKKWLQYTVETGEQGGHLMTNLRRLADPHKLLAADGCRGLCRTCCCATASSYL